MQQLPQDRAWIAPVAVPALLTPLPVLHADMQWLLVLWQAFTGLLGNKPWRHRAENRAACDSNLGSPMKLPSKKPEEVSAVLLHWEMANLAL